MSRESSRELLAGWLRVVGVEYVLRPSCPAADAARHPAGAPDSAPGAETLEDIRRELAGCRRCPLCSGRSTIVFGTGNPRARLMFVGEGPGVDEDRQGEPFVGAAGKRLNQWIGRIGLRRVVFVPAHGKVRIESRLGDALHVLGAVVPAVGGVGDREGLALLVGGRALSGVSLWSDARRQQWDQLESRVEQNTLRLMELLAHFETKATFFVLGWVAERHPRLVKALAKEGHEIASHGYGHELVTNQTDSEFRDDVRRSKCILEDLTGEMVFGYRAPSFSITDRTPWALAILVEEGYLYDSSIYARFQRAEKVGKERGVREIVTTAGNIFEVALPTANLCAIQLPIAGTHSVFGSNGSSCCNRSRVSLNMMQ